MSFPRYPKYKVSGVEWLGDVPDHWEIKRLKKACDVFPSNVDKKSHDGETPVQLCNYTDVYYNDTITAVMEFMAATASQDQIAKFTLRAGDTIITKDSETADDIANAAYVPSDLPGVVCGYHLSIVRPRAGTDGAFVKRLFDSIYAKSCFAVLANGLTRVGLGQYELDNVKLPFPPLPEQNRIAAFLEQETAKIDGLVAEQRRLMDLLKEKRRAAISRAVTQGLNAQAPMKSSGIEWLGEVPAHWEVTRLANLFREAAEPGLDELPILTVSIHRGVSDKEVGEDDLERKFTRSDDRTKYKRVAPGDLVYNMMRAWQGGFGAVTVEGMVSPAYVVARPRRPLETAFIEKLLRTPQAIEQMRRHSQGVTDFRLRLYWDEFKNLGVALPPQEEAIAICAHIAEMEASFKAMCAACEESIALLQERRTALISAAVTGQIDVRREIMPSQVMADALTAKMAREILAAEILAHCHAERTTGRIKLQKLIHLCEHVGELEEVCGDYERQAAGPFDGALMDEIAIGLRNRQWFSEEESEGRFIYRPLEKAGEHTAYLDRWGSKLAKVRRLIDLLKASKTKRCEKVSTLYAAWNDLLIEGRSPTDAEIIHEASDAERWHESKTKISPEEWATTLQWMKEAEIVPTGFGNHTRLRGATRRTNDPTGAQLKLL